MPGQPTKEPKKIRWPRDITVAEPIFTEQTNDALAKAVRLVLEYRPSDPATEAQPAEQKAG